MYTKAPGPKPLPPKIRRILAIAAEDFGVTVQAILSGTKVGETGRARRAVCHMLRRQGHSLPQIGRWLNLHHTSVLHAVKQPISQKDHTIPVPDLSGEWAI